MDWVNKQVTLNTMLYKQLPVGIAYVKLHNPHIIRGYANGFPLPVGQAIRQAKRLKAYLHFLRSPGSRKYN